MADIDDAFGPEHFPTCSCFSGMDAASSRQKMHELTELLCNSVAMNLQVNNVCPGAVPHYLAMMAHRLLSIAGAQNMPDLTGADLTDEQRRELARQTGLAQKMFMERMVGHMERTVRVLHSDARGGERVQ